MQSVWNNFVTKVNSLFSTSSGVCEPVTIVSSQGEVSTPIYGDHVFIASLIIVILVIIGAAVFVARFYRSKNAQEVGPPKPRIRKRDRIRNFGRKVLRNVGNISAGANKRKKIISKLTRKLLRKKENLPAQLQVLEPPAEYLQEDDRTITDQRLPPEVSYMLQSIRIFGIFERPLFLELCKHMETLNVSAGQFLFRIGEADENFFVVQSGCLNVYITEADGSAISLKSVVAGDSIASLLSFTDVLTGHPQPFKTVSAQALEDSVVLKLPVAAFQEVFEKNPETFVRVIQIIMVRLHRVTFTALHQHLGLTAELVTPTSAKRKSVAFSGITGSPIRRNTQQHMVGGGSFEDTGCTPDLLDSDYQPHSSNSQQQNRQGENPLFRQSSVHNMRKRFSAPIQISSYGEQQQPQSGGSEFYSQTSQYSEDDTEVTISRAIEVFQMSLGLEDSTLLQSIIQLREVPAGTYIAKEESQQDCGLVLVLSGLLTMTQRENDRDIFMFNAHSGDFVGAMSVLTGEPSVFTVRAKHHSMLAVMSSADFYSLMTVKPKIVLHVAHIVVKRLSPFVRQIDFAMDWSFLESGRALYKQSEPSDSTYIVLSGRLRSVITRVDGKKQMVAEYGRGDLVGIVETLTCSPRGTTAMAVRDTELAKLPDGLLNAIKLKYPIVVTRLIKLLGNRIIGSWEKPSSMSTGAVDSNKPSRVNFCTVAVLGVTDDVPLSAFTFELLHSVSGIGPSLRLTNDFVKSVLGSTIMEPANEYRLNSWLAQQEDKHRIVLYQCDPIMTIWTQRCIRQADCILIVGMGDGDPAIGKMEKQLELKQLAIRTQKELVLLHREGGEKPKNTALWLNNRSWCSSHHHLQCPKRMFTKKGRPVRAEYYTLISRIEPNVHSDFSRLARWLTGTSVGLVLGGGGARGAAHIGMIKAIQDAGIPIDMVGGVSIGAFVGALWCAERNVTTMTTKSRDWARKMTQWWRQLLDLTYPVTSMFSGAGFNETIKDIHDETQIEDLWLPYFAVTTDITSSTMRVHTHGSLWRYIRASMSLSGYMPPLCDPKDGNLLLDGGYVNNLPGTVWRAIRGSMSIAGVFPPLCDIDDGHLLVDGCYVNNLPSDVMRSHGARYILAVDVGSQDDTDLTNYGDSLSGWWLLWQRWTSHFRTNTVKVPNLPDIQSRLAYVSCVRQLEEVRNSDYCHYIRPPIDKYKTLQFSSFDEIKDVGYNHGKTYFDGMLRGSSLLPPSSSYGGSQPYLQRVASSRSLNNLEKPLSGSYNFTDLAQLVCQVRSSFRIPGGATDEDFTDDDTEYETGMADFIYNKKNKNMSAKGEPHGGGGNFSDNVDSEVEFSKTDC